MTSKFAVIADLHIRGSDLKATGDALLIVEHELKKRKVDTLFIAGDVFDKATIGDSGYPAPTVGKLFNDFLSVVRYNRTDVVVINGNHDFAGPGRTSAIELFNRDIILHTEVSCSTIKGLNYIPIPWRWGEAMEPQYKTIMSFIEEQKPSLIVGHCNIQNQAYRPGKFHEQKDDFKCSWEMSEKFARELKKLCPVVRFGHYHKRSEFFVGGIREMNFGEEGNPCGMEVYSETPSGFDMEYVSWESPVKHKTFRYKNPSKFPVISELDFDKVRVVCDGWKPNPFEKEEFIRSGGVVEVQNFDDEAKRVIVPVMTDKAKDASPREMIQIWHESKGGQLSVDLNALQKEFDRCN